MNQSINTPTWKEYLLYLRDEFLLNARTNKLMDTILGWHGGKLGSYRYEVNVEKKPSKLGIDQGKVVKLCLWDSNKGMINGCLASYDGRWNVKPDRDYEPYIKQILQMYNF